jgi:hypothetical protein
MEDSLQALSDPRWKASELPGELQGRPHPLTGEKERIRRSGFETEDDAWDAMREAQAALASETYIKPTRATVADFFQARFAYVRSTTEPTTAANYEALAQAYVLPWIGRRPMQDIIPSVIAALYDQLLREGRRKRDTNWEMYQLWRAAKAAKREIRSRELADQVGVSYAGARRAIARYAAGRIPTEPQLGLSPKTVKSLGMLWKCRNPLTLPVRGFLCDVGDTGIEPVISSV